MYYCPVLPGKLAFYQIDRARRKKPHALNMADGKRGSRPRLTWDEETIAEHDKDRGTRMKIDEPDTPYEKPYDYDKEEEDGTLPEDVSPTGQGLAAAAAAGEYKVAEGAGGGGAESAAPNTLFAALTSKLEGVREKQESMPTAAAAAVDAEDGIVAQRALEKKQEFERARMNHYGNQRAVMEEAKRLIEAELRGGGDDDDTA